MSGAASASSPRVLVAGDVPEHERATLAEAGLQVDCVPSLLAAIAALRDEGAQVLVALGDDPDRERTAFAAARRAGASRIVAVYPPHLAHRAEQGGHAEGPDATLALPAYPGALVAAVRGLLRRDDGTTASAATAREPAPVTTPSGRVPPVAPRDGPSMEALVGDIAVFHRAVTDLDRLMDHLVATFVRRSGAGRCSLMLRERKGGRDELVVRRSQGLPDHDALPRVPVGEGPSGRVAQTGEALLVTDAGGADERSPGTYRTGSYLILPLRAAEGVLGVVCLSDKLNGRAFDDDDRRAFQFLADHAAQALENAQKFGQLRELSVIDELTGLHNRRHFDRALDREIQRARRYDRQVSLALLDLDHFKAYNDLCGHPAGDRALTAVGEILRSQLREVDIVSRYGGEEFAIILPETNARPSAGASNPFPFLERLREAIETAVFPGEERMPSGCLTVSGGVACFPDDADSAESLLDAADKALYEAKSQGRNRVVYRGRAIAAG